MSRDNCKEFPYLSDEAVAAYRAVFPCAVDPFMDHDNRRNLSAFLREVMMQAAWQVDLGTAWAYLGAIAANLHNPSPPPPTLAQAREADLESPAGRDLVRDFLANLATETQP